MLELVELAERTVGMLNSSGVSEAEAYFIETYSTDLKYVKGEIDVIRSGRIILAGLRVALGRRIAIVGGTISSLSDAMELAESGIKIARASPEDPNWRSLPKSIGKAPVGKIFDERIANPDVEWSKYVLIESAKIPRELSSRASLANAGFKYVKMKRVIMNSYADAISDDLTKFLYYVEVKAFEGGSESGFTEFHASATLEDFSYESIVKKATERALAGLRAKTIETGEYNIVLTPKVFGSIAASVLAPALYADNVQKNRSPLVGKIGEEVLSNEVNIVDDGCINGFYSTQAFDDEGVPTKRKNVFKKGVLETYLYDNYTAQLESRESTGNGLRRNPSSIPRPSITNLLIEPGGCDLDSAVSDLSRVIVVYGTIGEWLSNPISGLINATITNADLIESGRVLHGVKGAVLAGNVYSLLKEQYLLTTKDVENYFNVYSPAIAFREVSIAGK
ncbi:MAG: TldD/PmbA family protein [Sulfolobales archaeon]|nr:TldD/PmbA family protein [Sulfolobales archaeon]MCX8198816.1 TldD/PmbA family protein [Sulfolobales archaeon]MDW8170786.1 TldD/PmbA family protein [Desulfurococcaceae archaeon]